VAVEAANTDPNPKYFDKGRGVTFYLHFADVGPPFGRQVISTNESEALYVIDTLCHHETEFDIQEHYTDTAAATEQVFALCAFLGFRYAPRMAHVLDRQLFTIGRPADYGPLNSLIHGRVNQRLIRQQWAEKQRIAASIRHGTSPASVLMRKLASYPRQNRVAAAFTEMGKVERTLFLLEFMHDEALQRRVQVGLNKGESANSLARAILGGRRGILYDRTLQAQLHRASCLVLVMAAITAWNTVYLQAAIQTLRQSGTEVPDDLLAHISPNGWEHINLLGRYLFTKTNRSLDNLRPLRSQAQMVIDESDEE
jgi:TnpA family transposase